MRDILHTDRLTLRPVTLNDANAFSRYASDWDIARMTGSIAYPLPRLSAEFKIMTFKSAKRRNLAHPYAITRKDEAEMIGVTDLFRRSEDGPWELGYWLARPFWGTGLVTEANRAILAEADRAMGPADRVAGVYTDNPGSMRVLEKLGFEPVGEPEPYFSMARLKHAASQSFVLRAA